MSVQKRKSSKESKDYLFLLALSFLFLGAFGIVSVVIQRPFVVITLDWQYVGKERFFLIRKKRNLASLAM